MLHAVLGIDAYISVYVYKNDKFGHVIYKILKIYFIL